MLYGMLRWRPQGVIRRGRFAASYGPDLSCGHPGALHSIQMCNGFALRHAKMVPARDHSPRSPRFALRRRPSVRTSWCAVQQPHLRSSLALHCGTDVGCGHPGALHRIHMRNAFAKLVPARYHPRRSPRSHCGTDLAYGHPGALRSIHIRSGFARRYPNMAPKTDRPPRSPRCALRHRPGVRTSWCSSQHRHPRWVGHTVFKNGARKGSSAAVASLRTAHQTWRTDIRVPCTPSTCAMGLPYSRP
jgi:hypothetical protein